MKLYKLASREDGDDNLRNDEEKDESNPSPRPRPAVWPRGEEEKRGGSNSRAGVTSCVVARGYNTRATSPVLFFPTRTPFYLFDSALTT